MRFLKKALPVILSALIGVFPAVGLALSPDQQEMILEIEGMPEAVLMTRYTADARFAIWYDAEHFSPEAKENGVRFELTGNQLDSEVSFTVENVSDPASAADPALEDFIAAYAAQGWDCEELDAAGMLPLFNDPEIPARGFIARREGEAALVYLSNTPSGCYLSVLRFPNEAAEGWGNRMLFMINTLESVVGY